VEITVNQPTKQVFLSTGLTTGKVVFPGVVALVDGVITTLAPAPTFTEIGGGVYTMNFTPSSTGHLDIFIEGALQIRVDVSTKTLAATVKDLSDEALGSWIWNKLTGVLTLYKSDTSVLATYNVIDTVTEASRERVS